MPFDLANFKTTQVIKGEKANNIFCETVLISKLNLKEEVFQPGNQVCFSCQPKMKADRWEQGTTAAQP